MTTSSRVVLTEGFTVSGKWHKRSYRITRLLGEGANGKVFLVQAGKQACALKIGYDALDLQMEVNVLKALDTKSAEPYLYDSDDVELDGAVYPFYVMRYVRGMTADLYIGRNGADWIPLVGLNLLRKLHSLHRQGYVFGDLKLDNVLVSGYGDVELVDYGGVTEKGRSVKQFTELHDRGFWNAGERTADDGYDLFGFSVFVLQLYGMDKRLQELAAGLPQNRGPDDLLKLVGECARCKPLAPVLKRAIEGRYARSAEAAADWRRAMEKMGASSFPGPSSSTRWIKAAFLGSIGLFVSALYLFFMQP